MKRTVVVLSAALLLAPLAGCSPAETPDEAAWSECIAFYNEHKPDGMIDAETGETFDSDRTCHNMIGHRGQDQFTAFWNDPDRVADYARGF